MAGELDTRDPLAHIDPRVIRDSEQEYRTLTCDEVVEYVKRWLPHLVHHLGTLTCCEFGDGNLNNVFRVSRGERKEGMRFGGVARETKSEATEPIGGGGGGERDRGERQHISGHLVTPSDEELHPVSSLIVKQALPYVRCVGDSWPLSPRRAHSEAKTLLTHGWIRRSTTVRVYLFDPSLCLLVLEDLKDYTVLRDAYINMKHTEVYHLRRAAEEVAVHMALTHYYTSDFYCDPKAKQSKVIEFANPELCAITEDLFFTAPYLEGGLSSSQSSTVPRWLRSLQLSSAYHYDEMLSAVHIAKHHFTTKCEALIHGDLHTGSVFMGLTGHGVAHDCVQVKIIDAEFGFYGPMGFDVGSFIGNLIINFAAQCGLMKRKEGYPTPHTVQMQRAINSSQPTVEGQRAINFTLSNILDHIKVVWERYRDTLTSLIGVVPVRHNLIPFVQTQSRGAGTFREAIVSEIFEDVVRYAACEVIRRVIGLGKVKDMLQLNEKEQFRPNDMEKYQVVALNIAIELLRRSTRQEVRDIDQMLNCVKDVFSHSHARFSVDTHYVKRPNLL